MRGETVTILRAGPPTTDRYGNEVPGADVPTDLENCLVASRLRGDATDAGRQGVIVGTTVYVLEPELVRTGVTVLATDRLMVRGEPHTIEGDVGVWPGAGVEVATKRVEG